MESMMAEVAHLNSVEQHITAALINTLLWKRVVFQPFGGGHLGSSILALSPHTALQISLYASCRNVAINLPESLILLIGPFE
jgi:hypothetical protein